jgi:NADPH:quinone reductase-like Zn-dependent oxidoreductase
MNPSDTQLQLRSLVKKSGELEVSLQRIPIAEPAADEVVVRIEAAPLNPSDLGLLFGTADLTQARSSGTSTNPVVTAPIPEQMMRAMSGRVDQSLAVGNEGAGVVVKAGTSSEAQALMGKTVAVLGGEMYSQYRTLKLNQAMVLPPGTRPSEGASCFVNPLTALGMVETMRREAHTALVHTAAASNLDRCSTRSVSRTGSSWSISCVNKNRKICSKSLVRDTSAIRVLLRSCKI